VPDKTGPLQADPPKRESGRYAPGSSGNPSGRPRGSRNRVSELAHDLLGGAAEEVVQRLIVMARDGDRFALRLVLDRVAPVRRDRRVDLAELRDVSTAADLVIASGQVIALAASGDLTLEESRAFMALLRDQRAAIDAADLHARVEALELELEREKGRER
jgi:hypothetical protein